MERLLVEFFVVPEGTPGGRDQIRRGASPQSIPTNGLFSMNQILTQEFRCPVLVPSLLNGDFLFNWIRTLNTCPSWVHRTSAITVCTRLLASVLCLTPVAAEADQPIARTRSLVSDEVVAQADALEKEAYLAVLNLAFKGYVAIVFPVGPDNSCEAQASEVTRRFRDAYRSWYELIVTPRCAGMALESYRIWFLCSKRNGLSCSLIAAPLNQSEMKP